MINLKSLSGPINQFVKGLEVESIPGAVNLCHEGCLFQGNKNQGLGFSSLALKILYTIDTLDQISTEKKKAWSEYIKSYQVTDGKMTSYFEDSHLLASLDGLKIRNVRIRGPFKFIKDKSVRIAETRQALAALNALGEKANLPISFLPKSKEDTQRYFWSLGWKNPWHAGSQIGHLLYFLKYNKDFFNQNDELMLSSLVWTELAKLRREDGAWYVGSPKRHIVMNGIMKVLISYNLYGKEIEYPEKLIDLSLDAKTRADGCHLLDQVYILHASHRFTNYRSNEIKDFVSKMQEQIMRHFKGDGFSFYPNKSQTNYYGKKVSKGMNVADIHGTHLFTWALALIDEVVKDYKECLWKLPPT